MSKHVRLWGLGATVLALGGLVYLAGQGSAGEDKAIRDTVVKIAATLRKGDKEGAEKQAEALAKKLEALGDAMDVFKLRKKGGLGVGAKAGTLIPDGIDLQLNKLQRDAPSAATLSKEAAALEEMAYVIAAMAEVARVKLPTFKGKQNKKEWLSLTEDMRAGAKKLAEAAKAKAASEVKTASSKIVAACNTCHSNYRD